MTKAEEIKAKEHLKETDEKLRFKKPTTQIADRYVDLERGTTFGSIDAANIPVPTNLRREVPVPGAFRQAGPGARNTNDVSTSSSLTSVPSDSRLLVTAELVVEQPQSPSNEASAVVLQATQSHLVRAEEVYVDEHKKDSIVSTTWTQRNIAIAIVVAVIIAGVVIGLSVAIANRQPVVTSEAEGSGDADD